MTITVCVDQQVNWRPGLHVSRWGRRFRSVRVWWLWFAFGWYRFSDYHLVAESHEWSES